MDPVAILGERLAMGRRAALIVTVLCAAATLGFIAWQGRAVPVPDGPVGPDGGFPKVSCVSYAPYAADQTPFDETLVIPPAQIERDMSVLTTLSDCVRTYSVGQGLDRVVDIAGRHGLKVYAGAWIGRNPQDNEKEIAHLLEVANAHPDVLKGVIVGNEVLLRGDQPAAVLEGYLRQVRRGLPASVPVTYADVWEFWLKHPELTDAVDFVTVHILPYWEDEPTRVDRAVDHVMAVWRQVSAFYAPKPVLIGETGWPSAGRRREGAEPGSVEQARFLRGFISEAEAAGAWYNLIEAFDQPWKRSLEGTVGGAWGLFDAHRVPKVTLTGPVTEHPEALWWLGGAVVVGLLPLVVAGIGRRRRSPPLRLAALGAGGVFLAATLVLQAWHMREASRDAVEWAVNGGWLAVSAGIGLVALRRIAGLPCRLDLDRLRFLATAAMTVACLGLLFAARYRDMPASMFLGVAVLLALVPPPVERPQPRERRAMAWVLALSALGVLVNEGPMNTHAWVWTATALVLAAPTLGLPVRRWGVWRRAAG